ncbi:SDR family NAD(P)-dependent oxidoreductase [Streptomyces sp. NPDC020719]|uniref:SDR family NAD(P)-dependent oxidoreductase n=1 Tax=Streptomyces sp. NPDC020719 TaxID=3154896 RepID=UPI0033D4EB44
MSSSLLAGRVALVTGASRGIGAAVARALGAHGASVAVNYLRSAEAAARVVADIEKSGGRAVAVAGDASDLAQVRAMVATATAELGTPDVLVCNVMVGADRIGAKAGAARAGAKAGTPGGSFIDTPDGIASVRDAVASQLDATLACCHAVIPGMRRAGGGSIVLIGASTTHNPYPVPVEIAAAKSAQDAVGRSLARELAPDNIRVNTLAPGFVPTDANAGPFQATLIAHTAEATPLPNPITPEDVADAVVLLTSDLSTKITGTFVPLDGGRTLI